MQFPRIIWSDMISRMDVRFGVEVVLLRGGTMWFRRTVDGVHHLFHPVPKFRDNPVTHRWLARICDALRLDMELLLKD